MSSSALSAAKRRRGVPVNNNPSQSNAAANENNVPQTPANNDNRPMSIQEALQLLSTRIVKLEKNIEETPKNEFNNNEIETTNELNIETIIEKVAQSQLFEEFNARYEILASEIMTLKHIVMKLQSYTLDINKTLVEERIQILSEIPEKGGISILEVKDDLNLRSDIENMIENSDLQEVLETDKELLKTQIEEDLMKETTPVTNKDENEEVQENISMSIENAE